MDICQAMTEMRNGKRLTRSTWFSTYYVYMDYKFPGKFQFVSNQQGFTDEDLLANDWKIWIDPYATTNKISEVTNNA